MIAGMVCNFFWLGSSHVLNVTTYITGPESMGFGILRALHFEMNDPKLLYQIL